MKKQINILLADDDHGYALLLQEAAKEGEVSLELHSVLDGTELFNFLTNLSSHEFPDLILLDLNMPGKDGIMSLEEIKSHPGFKKIPVIIFSTSASEDMIDLCYDLGANSYIVKPFEFPDMIAMLQQLARYWTQLSRLPGRK